MDGQAAIHIVPDGSLVCLVGRCPPCNSFFHNMRGASAESFLVPIVSGLLSMWMGRVRRIFFRCLFPPRGILPFVFCAAWGWISSRPFMERTSSMRGTSTESCLIRVVSELLPVCTDCLCLFFPHCPSSSGLSTASCLYGTRRLKCPRQDRMIFASHRSPTAACPAGALFVWHVSASTICHFFAVI